MPDTQTIVVSTAGGLLIGLAAATFLLGTGRIAGISGLFGAVISRRRDRIALLFLAGLLAAPWIAQWLGIAMQPSAPSQPNWIKLVAAGLLVGVGTQIGSGCTSGHGVCGLANLSPRGLTATLIFMGIAALVVAIGWGGLA